MRLQAALLLAVLLVSGHRNPASGYIALRWGATGVRVRWDASRFPLVFQINDKSARGLLPNVIAGSDPQAAVRAALSAWQSIPTASIRFSEAQLTSLESAASDDGVNLITMANTATNTLLLGGDSRTLALTRVVYSVSTGRILDTDVIFNPKVTFSTTLAADSFDLQSVATHELGHALGCDHAAAQNDTMFYTLGREVFFPRYLSADAISFAAAAYPNTSRADGVGSISGSVKQDGKGVFGASVTAIDLNRNRIYTALSEPDGSYTITGPISGRYALYAEPLDGPATADTLLAAGRDAYYGNINTSFRTVFKDDLALQPSRAHAARLEGVDFILPSIAATLNVNRMGRAALDSAEGTISDRPAVVNPGESCNLLVGGPETWKVQSVDDVSILGTGISLDRARGLRTLRNASGVEVGVAVAIKVASDAAPGARALRLRVGDQAVASTGGIVVTARSLPVQTLYFPYLLSSSDQYTGLAIANPSPTPAVVRVTGRDEQGDLLYDEEAVVPADLAIAGGAQTAQLAGQVFNLTSTARQSGSVTIVSDNKSVASFFLTGDLKGNYLDGAEAFTRAYRQLYFVDVLQNLSTVTELHLQNVKDAAVTVALTLTAGNGTVLGSTATRTIPAGGKLGESVSSLFSYSADLRSAHVKAAASDDAIVGFAYVRQRDTTWGLNAQPVENALASLYSPQLATGDFGAPFRTRLNVVNVGDSSAAVTLTVMSDAGDPLAGPIAAGVLASGAHLTLDAASFFNFVAATQGSLKITAPAGAKLLGNVVFSDGDPQNGRLEFGAALPLVGSGISSFMFSQIAQGQGFYTGLAFLAPEGAEIKLEAFDQQGVSVGRGAVSLTTGGRRVSLLDALIPETRGQVRGYVTVTATRPVIGFELLGAIDGRFLAAVVPQALAK